MTYREGQEEAEGVGKGTERQKEKGEGEKPWDGRNNKSDETENSKFEVLCC